MPNAVDKPILNNPFREPTQYWDFSGPSPRIVEGRRPAGYYGTLRTEDRQGAVASNPTVLLQTVNEIRHRVQQWRDANYPNVTPVTRDLLDHWSRERERPLFFCQREAVETIIWLTEAKESDRAGIEVPADVPNDAESIVSKYPPLRRYCAKMATGSGKTTVMAMIAAWSVLNKVTNRQDPRFSDSILVVGPNLTVKERLGVLDPKVPGNYYEAFDLVPNGYRDLLSKGRIFITNWHVFGVRDDSGKRSIVQRGRESDSAFVRRALQRELGSASNILVMNDEAHHAYRPARPVVDDQLELEGLTKDEAEEAKDFAEEATVWVGGLDRINKVRGIRLVIDVSATPFYLKGTGYQEGAPLPWIVSDFGLVDAIESGITKVPRVPVADDSGQPVPKYFRLWRHIMDRLPPGDRETNRRKAKPEAVWREAQGALTTLADKWKTTLESFEASQYPVPPALIVVCANTALAEIIEEALQRGDVTKALAGEHTFRIDSKKLAEAESSEDGASKDDLQQLLRLKTSTVGKAAWPDGRPPAGFEDLPEPPGKNVRCVVSVGMLTEGWDASNVTQILGLRAFSTQLLCEQVVGRGLRRMSYDIDPDTQMLVPEYCDVFGIPFEVIPVQGTTPQAMKPPPPSVLVQALAERKELEITFPRVEGFVADMRGGIRCDVDGVAPITVEPQIEPMQTVVRTQAGWVVGQVGLNTSTGTPETFTRDRFYAEHRLQKTAFGIARDITEVLAGGRVSMGAQPEARAKVEAARLLFPQALAIVDSYLARRVRLSSSAAHIEEIALAKYRDVVVERLLRAIEPETGSTSTLLPRIERHRPTGSTAEVQFRTTKPTQGTSKSHISHVVLDSTYEASAAFQLEQSKRVLAYAKNDRLDFEILYDWQGSTHRYIPDYLVRISLPDDAEMTLILEMKGNETEQDRAKWTAARQWVRAVNRHGGFGLWDHFVVKEPNRVREAIERYSPPADVVQQVALSA